MQDRFHCRILRTPCRSARGFPGSASRRSACHCSRGDGSVGGMTPLQLVLAGGAGFAAGGVNALAGGGTLISFPVLIALGLPPVSANVTNTVALSPGYLGGAVAQRRAIAAQSQRVRGLVVAAGAGGLAGSILLLITSDDTFRVLIPVLLLVATALLALQDRIRVALRIGQPSPDGLDAAAPAPADPRGLAIP